MFFYEIVNIDNYIQNISVYHSPKRISKTPQELYAFNVKQNFSIRFNNHKIQLETWTK